MKTRQIIEAFNILNADQMHLIREAAPPVHCTIDPKDGMVVTDTGGVFAPDDPAPGHDRIVFDYEG